jgi:hypothetical protein
VLALLPGWSFGNQSGRRQAILAGLNSEGTVMKPFPVFLKEQASKDPENESDRTKREWISSVERLIAQAQDWLEHSDRHTKVLRLVVDNDHSIDEEGLGMYKAPCLQIWLGKKVVEMCPVARNVVGVLDEGRFHLQVQGRVDISSGTKKMIAYRIKTENVQDRWTLLDLDQNAVSELDRTTLEAAIQSLLE